MSDALRTLSAHQLRRMISYFHLALDSAISGLIDFGRIGLHRATIGHFSFVILPSLVARTPHSLQDVRRIH